MTDSRLTALQWLLQVIEKGRSVNELFISDVTKQSSDKDGLRQQALARQILFGCLRYYHQLKTLSDNLLDKPFKSRDTDLLIVILMGLYQLRYLSTPDHAAISESVELTRHLKKPWASGLVNGLLRRYQRESVDIEKSLEKSLQFKFSHPGWIVKRVKQDWAEDYQQILEENNQQAPMILRVNTLKNSREDWLEKLNRNGMSATIHPVARDGLVLERAADVGLLPGFFEGEVTVQDAAAQLAVELLELQPGQKVLDACAAPGGKTTHILQREKVNLTAVEMVARRAERISSTLTRLQMDNISPECQVICADVSCVEQWWDGELFDRILLDVPCSASGVIRRNPDIKLHRKVTDLKSLLTTQQNILKTVWPLLKPGGILVYATCSVFKAENEQQMNLFLSENQAEPIQMPEDIHALLSCRAETGYQIFPGEYQMDGFYLCGLKKPI